MAIVTRSDLMRPGQREIGHVVIDRRRLPRARRVTLSAFSRKLGRDMIRVRHANKIGLMACQAFG